MKRNRDIKTRQIKKWKARLNVDDSIMKKGTHYDKVYSLVAGWTYIRILMILLALEGWKTMTVYTFKNFHRQPLERTST